MELKPQIVAPDYGKHNADLDATVRRVKANSQWKKLDTIMIIPAGPSIPSKVVMSWLNMYSPPNNKLFRMMTINCEVGIAYSTAIENILSHPELSKFKYLFTLEHDNVPQPDCMVKLLESMENHPEFSAISALYFLKGPDGVAQIWGDPKDPALNFRPQPPVSGQIVECCGTGMGAVMWRLDMFKDPRLKKPWFRTVTENGVGTQDLAFASDARQHGYRFAVDCRIPCGHYDLVDDICW